jgi:hypothetical protein
MAAGSHSVIILIPTLLLLLLILLLRLPLLPLLALLLLQRTLPLLIDLLGVKIRKDYIEDVRVPVNCMAGDALFDIL